MNVDSPRPTRMQNIALAMLPVIAISPKPFLVIAREALKSANELPQQINVRAKIEGQMVSMYPNKLIQSITMFETNDIHVID